jgi:hypothetical protein
MGIDKSKLYRVNRIIMKQGITFYEISFRDSNKYLVESNYFDITAICGN